MYFLEDTCIFFFSPNLFHIPKCKKTVMDVTLVGGEQRHFSLTPPLPDGHTLRVYI